ncbi:MAG: glycosyltransferase [Candidatus Shapirobacteria bacterium]|nr:glycosyltransferase [Candidatus Shapirobacteria bacterium]MDD3002720.1 glycosyltransferase [Candidatus Shapirobacteria bacterium]MDD4382909.1 glycosyltransferase [Candidatus Shapirobacteria bacterium]
MKSKHTKPHYSKEKTPKIAIIQDYIKEFGGAESVLETLSEIFPNAPIYTTLYKPEFLGPHQFRLQKKWDNRVHQSFFQYIPFAHKIISPLRLLSPLAFKSFDFSQFDIIITSATGAYFPNLINKKNAKLISYCHTPPRYLYGLPTARNFTKNKFIYALIQILNHFLRITDFKSAQNVDQFIANSQTTADRIKKFYRRDSIIINPPIEINQNNLRSNIDDRQNYFLAGGRLARAKRYDIAIKACNQLNLKLKIFGRDFAGFSDELKAMASSSIEFLGEVTQDQKDQLYSQAKAFIFCSDNEDFGMVPVESMAHGCPVIAYKSGGTTETVIDGKTGVFFDELTSKSCVAAIQKFQKLKINPQDCISRASDFSTEKFISKIKKLVLKD